MESQRLRRVQLSPGPVSCSELLPLRLEHLRRWRCHNLSRKTVSVFDHPRDNLFFMYPNGISHVFYLYPVPLILLPHTSENHVASSLPCPLTRSCRKQRGLSFPFSPRGWTGPALSTSPQTWCSPALEQFGGPALAPGCHPPWLGLQPPLASHLLTDMVRNRFLPFGIMKGMLP